MSEINDFTQNSVGGSGSDPVATPNIQSKGLDVSGVSTSQFSSLVAKVAEGLEVGSEMSVSPYGDLDVPVGNPENLWDFTEMVMHHLSMCCPMQIKESGLTIFGLYRYLATAIQQHVRFANFQVTFPVRVLKNMIIPSWLYFSLSGVKKVLDRSTKINLIPTLPLDTAWWDIPKLKEIESKDKIKLSKGFLTVDEIQEMSSMFADFQGQLHVDTGLPLDQASGLAMPVLNSKGTLVSYRQDVAPAIIMSAAWIERDYGTLDSAIAGRYIYKLGYTEDILPYASQFKALL